MRTLSLLLFTCLLFACGQDAADATTADTITTEPAAQTEKSNSFGAEFTPEKVIPATGLLTAYDDAAILDTVTTALRGTVNEVCQKKGCWMTIAAGTEDEIMVKFKDYGFFMPLDISGREVVMNGMAYYQVTPVDELRHYAEDAGKSAEEIAAITEPKRELHFLADGVQLMTN